MNFKTKQKRTYKCETCAKIFTWDENSLWYGSYYYVEEHPEKLKFFCNKKCIKQAVPEEDWLSDTETGC